jgi:hypothetical protein
MAPGPYRGPRKPATREERQWIVGIAAAPVVFLVLVAIVRRLQGRRQDAISVEAIAFIMAMFFGLVVWALGWPF